MAPFFSFGKKNKKAKSNDVGQPTVTSVYPGGESHPIVAPTSFAEEKDGYSFRDGYMKPVYPSRPMSSQGFSRAVDGPAPEDYARWNNAPSMASRIGHERASSFSFVPGYAPSGEQGPEYYQAAQQPFHPAPQPNKLRRRTVSGPTAPNPNVALVSHTTASVKGEDPLKRMKYDLQVSTFLLNKLKTRPAPSPLGNSRRQNRPVDPRNLVDPWIDGRHGTEFHQIHNHGLLLHPYAPVYPVYPPPQVYIQPQPQVYQSYQPHRPSTSSGERSRKSSDVSGRTQQWVEAHSDAKHPRRKRHASDATPPARAQAFPVASQPSASGQEYVFGTFRKPSSHSQAPLPPSQASSSSSRKHHRQSMPATLKPELIVPVDDDASGGSSGKQQRRVRFRGKDSVIGSPPPAKAAFNSLPHSQGSSSGRH